MDRQLFVNELTQYLVQKRPHREPPGPEANLWTMGYLDSLSIVELILFVESVTGAELAVADIHSLQSIAEIYDNYVKSRGSAS